MTYSADLFLLDHTPLFYAHSSQANQLDEATKSALRTAGANLKQLLL